MMKRKAAARPQAALPPGVDKGAHPLMFIPALAAQGELPRRGKRGPPGGCTAKRMKTEGFRTLRVLPPGGPPAGGSVPARLPRRNFLCGRSLYQPPPFLWSAFSTKKAPFFGGAVLTPCGSQV